MIKTLFRFLLSLCFLLLIGYGHVHAHIRQTSICYSPIKIRKGSAYTNVCTLQNQHTFISASSSYPKKKKFKIHAPDIERKEDDLNTSERYLEFGHHFIAIFNAQPPGHFFHNIKRSLASFVDISYCSSYGSLYLILQVVRI